MPAEVPGQSRRRRRLAGWCVDPWPARVPTTSPGESPTRWASGRAPSTPISTGTGPLPGSVAGFGRPPPGLAPGCRTGRPSSHVTTSPTGIAW